MNTHIIRALCILIVGILIGNLFFKCKKEGFNSIKENIDNIAVIDEIPPPYDQQDFFLDTQFSPECCKPSLQSYSNSLGCVCITASQAQYLNERGGNRTFS